MYQAKNNYFFLGVLLCSLYLACSFSETPSQMPVPNPFAKSEQLLIVTSPNDSMITGTMYRFERKGQHAWQAIGEAHPVTLGKHGMGWGQGLHESQTGYYRTEGDGKSPMGIFSLGSAFGYAKAADAPVMELDYIHLDDNTQCIEDNESAYYNQIIQDTSIQKDWKVADFMRRDDDHVYKWGIFVNHNIPAQGKAGSCIFLHLWRAADKPTLGCTGMEEARLLDLLGWLSPKKEPRLVQLVESDYPRFQQEYGLPDLGFR